MEECQAVFDNRFTQVFGVPLERIRTKVKDFLPEPVKAQCFGQVCRRQYDVKRLALRLAFAVVAIHHQPDIHTRRPLPSQASVR